MKKDIVCRNKNRMTRNSGATRNRRTQKKRRSLPALLGVAGLLAGVLLLSGRGTLRVSAEPVDGLSLTPEQYRTWEQSQFVEKQNRKILTMENSQVADLRHIPAWFSKEELLELLASYDIVPNGTVFDGSAAPNASSESAAENRNLDGVPETVETEYGILICQSDMRSLPTAIPMWNAAGEFDLLQETGQGVGAPCAILHTSLDGEWSFVRMEDCIGWVPSENIAKTDRRTWEKWIIRRNEATDCVVSLDYHTWENRFLIQGTVLPYRTNDGSGITVALPEKDSSGKLTWNWTDLSNTDPACSSFARGYLEPSQEAVRRLQQRIDGIPYSWGDMDGYSDCSSTIQHLYRCMGYRLPRNSSAQAELPFEKISLVGLSNEQRMAIFSQQETGAVYWMPGHVMMAVSADFSTDGTPCMFHNVVRFMDDSGTLLQNFKAVETGLNIRNGAGVSYSELIQSIIQIPLWN